MKAVIRTAVLVAVAVGTGPVRAQATPSATQPEEAQTSSEPQATLDPAPKEDLEQTQGLWVRTERSGLFSSHRITKQIEGDKETLTEYDSNGKVTVAHTVKVKLYRAGPIRIFTYSDMTLTEGPNKGERRETTGAYIYKIVDDKFIEIWGVLGDGDDKIRHLRWTRQKTAP